MKIPENSKWSVVYKSALNEDGSLFFPERLTREFLDNARRTMGSFLFANQYLNEIIPEEEKKFRLEWLRYTTQIPSGCTRFGFIDPAIGQNQHNDYTGIAVVYCGLDKTWYLRLAVRYRLTPTQIVEKAFDLCEQFQLNALGIEQVGFQEALLYLLSEEMTKRDKFIPIKGVPRTRVSKNSRILGLVPRFEWGKLFCFPGMVDFEDEYNTFPRGSHDDILDALASLEELVYYPEEQEKLLEQPHSPHDPNFEKWNIQQLIERANSNQNGDGTLPEFDH